ncbi:hypothetical protein O3P69_006779 [Scylla paramamosain]|uniref:Uncharacterized protein n=1 Tax=Scylla paramamosain TaxID=85552 RepID=A0AAW0U2Q4_SCYPA
MPQATPAKVIRGRKATHPHSSRLMGGVWAGCGRGVRERVREEAQTAVRKRTKDARVSCRNQDFYMLLPQRKMPPDPSRKSGTRGSYPDEKWSAETLQCSFASSKIQSSCRGKGRQRRRILDWGTLLNSPQAYKVGRGEAGIVQSSRRRRRRRVESYLSYLLLFLSLALLSTQPTSLLHHPLHRHLITCCLLKPPSRSTKGATSKPLPISTGRYQPL